MFTKRKETKYIVVHCTWTSRDQSYGIERARDDHKKRGWVDVGYHYLIRFNGDLETGRSIDVAGAHARGVNNVSVGVALEGGMESGLDVENFTQAQFETLDGVINDLLKKYPAAVVIGHSDVPDANRTCPVFDVKKWCRERGIPTLSFRETAPGGKAVAPDARTAYLQRLLERAGYEPGPDDGVSGPETEAAIRAFQADAGLPVTGAFDPVTTAKLRGMVEKRTDPVIETLPEGLDKPMEASRTVWGTRIMTGVTAFLAWWGTLPVFLQVAIVLLVVGIGAFVIRERRQKAEAAAAARRGEVLPDPEPDWIDRAQANAVAIWYNIKNTMVNWFAPKEKENADASS